jgi:hypothetical protein
MALWPSAGASQVSSTANNASSTAVVVVTGSATPNTPGSWTTLIASTPFAVSDMTLYTAAVTNTSAADSSTLVDIAVGASGSEQVVVAGLPLGFISDTTRSVPLPLRVPSGARISARVQGAQASKAVSLGLIVTGSSGGWAGVESAYSAVSYGVNTGTSTGTALTGGGTANTKSAWTEISSATSARHRLLLAIPTGVAGNTNMTGCTYLYDIGIGASGSEVVLIPDMFAGISSLEALNQTVNRAVRCDIPSGTRLAARQQCSASGLQSFSLVLVGFS